MDWTIVKLPSGQIQEMVPHVAEALIAAGAAKRHVPEVQPVLKPVTAVVETASIEPARNAARFVRGPKSKKQKSL
jgi:hypothetical protein